MSMEPKTLYFAGSCGCIFNEETFTSIKQNDRNCPNDKKKIYKYLPITTFKQFFQEKFNQLTELAISRDAKDRLRQIKSNILNGQEKVALEIFLEVLAITPQFEKLIPWSHLSENNSGMNDSQSLSLPLSPSLNWKNGSNLSVSVNTDLATENARMQNEIAMMEAWFEEFAFEAKLSKERITIPDHIDDYYLVSNTEITLNQEKLKSNVEYLLLNIKEVRSRITAMIKEVHGDLEQCKKDKKIQSDRSDLLKNKYEILKGQFLNLSIQFLNKIESKYSLAIDKLQKRYEADAGRSAKVNKTANGSTPIPGLQLAEFSTDTTYETYKTMIKEYSEFTDYSALTLKDLTTAYSSMKNEIASFQFSVLRLLAVADVKEYISTWRFKLAYRILEYYTNFDNPRRALSTEDKKEISAKEAGLPPQSMEDSQLLL